MNLALGIIQLVTMGLLAFSIINVVRAILVVRSMNQQSDRSEGRAGN